MAAAAESVVADRLLNGAELVEALADGGHGQWEPETLRKWISHATHPCPVARRGKAGREHLYRLDDVIDWLADRTTRDTMAADPRVELDRQRARRARLEADRLEGLLIPTDEIEPAMGRVVDVTRTALLALTHTLTDRLALDDDQRLVVQACVEDVLHKLARRATSGLDAEDDDA